MVRPGGGAAVSSDPRARRSKEALEAALLDLVATDDLAQITISDITKRAGVSRSTFYEHYTDVHSLAASACTVIFDQLLATPMIDPSILDADPPEENPLTGVFRHFAGNERLYRSVLGPDGSARVINHLLHRIRVSAYTNRRITAAVSSTYAEGPAVIPHDPEAALIAGALVGIAVDWLHHGCPGSPEELAAAVWPQLLGIVAVNGLAPRHDT
jgi:AcrR family transcriptional regulator